MRQDSNLGQTRMTGSFPKVAGAREVQTGAVPNAAPNARPELRLEAGAVGRDRARSNKPVSPSPPLEPYVQLLPHTAHDPKGFLPFLCPVHPTVQPGIGLGVRTWIPLNLWPFPMCPAFLGSEYYGHSDCLPRPWRIWEDFHRPLLALLPILKRLSRVHRDGRIEML